MEQATLPVVLIDPAPGAVLTASPLSLLLAFDRPILPDTVNQDVVVVQIGADGNQTGWYTAPYDLTVDPSATRLTVALPETLGPGHYQVWLLGTSGIMDLDGNYLTDGSTNLVVGEFDVAVAGVTLGDTVDLGEPGSTSLDIHGALDFQAGSPGVSLYRIHLDPGHFWRLGLEVTAERDGGTLDTVLALFDDQGRPIATDESGARTSPMIPISLPVSTREPTTSVSRVWATFQDRGGAMILRRDPPGPCPRLRMGAPTHSTSWPTPWMGPHSPELHGRSCRRAHPRPDRPDPGLLPARYRSPASSAIWLRL